MVKMAGQLAQMATLTLISGRAATVVRPINREPHFVVPAGATGVMQRPALTDDGKLFVAMKLDDPIDGAELFEGEVHWVEDVTFLDFESDVLIGPESADEEN